MKRIVSILTLMCLLAGFNLVTVSANDATDEIHLNFEKTVISDDVFYIDSSLSTELKPFGKSIIKSGDMSIETIATKTNPENKALYISATTSSANFRIDPDDMIDLSDTEKALAIEFDFYIDSSVSRNGNIFLPFVRLRDNSASTSSYYYADKSYNLCYSGNYTTNWVKKVPFEADRWYNVRYVIHPEYGGLYYIDDTLFAYDNATYSNIYCDYVQIQFSNGAGACYIDNLSIASTRKFYTVNLDVEDFTPGTTKVGERVKLSAADLKSTESELKILSSTDRINWSECADVTDNVASVPAKELTTYYKAVVIEDGTEVRCSDTIGIYGTQDKQFEKLEKLVDNLNFENPALGKTFDISTGTLTVNGSVWGSSMSGKFNSDANFSVIADQPEAITNKNNGKCLQLTYTDRIPAYTAVTLMFPLKMKTESESISVSTCKSGVVVVEYDFATSNLGTDHVGSFRFEGANYIYLNLTPQGKFKFGGTVLDATYSVNTWYRIKSVIDLDNQVIQLYVDGEHVGDAPISDEIREKGLESFRIVCDTKANTGQVFFDNFDAYLAGDRIVAPDSSNIDFRGVRYVIDDEITYSMKDGDKLDIYAVISNSGVEDSCVCIFPLYNERGSLIDVEMRDVVFREGETLITVDPVIFENVTEGMRCKMLLWNLMK